MELFGGRRTSGTVLYGDEEIRVGIVPGTGMLRPKTDIPGVPTICPFTMGITT